LHVIKHFSNVISRIVSHYEESTGHFISQKSILSHGASCGLQCSGRFLGRIISSVWNGTVIPSHSLSVGQGYLNLKQNKTSDGDNQLIKSLDDSAINKLQILCVNRSKWILNCSVGQDKISIVKIPETTDVVPVNFEGRPIICEVSASLNQHSEGVTVRTHGDAVPFQDIVDQLRPLYTSLKDIETVIRVVDAASLCVGSAVPDEQSQDEQILHPFVLGSKLVTVIRNNTKMEKRLVSTSCLLLLFGVKACSKCQYVFRLVENSLFSEFSEFEIALS
jgi:hypothetical protein